MNPATRSKLLVGIVSILLLFYIVLAMRLGIVLIAAGGAVPIVLGIAVFLTPVIGAWVLYTTLRAGFAHQRLARRIHDEGLELATEDLPRMPSGRIERGAADELFAQVKQQWEADPDNWRNSYLLARAYDHAGDRSRARETMRRAVALEEDERKLNQGS